MNNVPLLIAKGRISGCYAEGFHVLYPDGTIRYNRKPTKEDVSQMLSDIKRHREILNRELGDLAAAEKILAPLVR
jgi:ABC-type iron transport system FetAB ATPase subunit